MSGLLMLLRITADILAQVGGKSSDSLPKTMVRLKVVLHNTTASSEPPLPKALSAFKLGHLEPLMIRYINLSVLLVFIRALGLRRIRNTSGARTRVVHGVISSVVFQFIQCCESASIIMQILIQDPKNVHTDPRG